MKYYHIGIPTQTPHEGEIYLEKYKLYFTRHDNNPYGIEWIRFAPDSTQPELVKTVTHVAFEVEDLEEAIKGKEILIAPDSPMDGLRVAFIVENGAPVEFVEFTK